MPELLKCDCGRGGLTKATMKNHQKSKVCQQARGVYQESAPAVVELDLDLQSVVDDVRGDPRLRAKSVRAAFAARGWPNRHHKGTVRDFLKEHKIPIIDTPRHTPAFEVSQYVQKRVEEIANA